MYSKTSSVASLSPLAAATLTTAEPSIHPSERAVSRVRCQSLVVQVAPPTVTVIVTPGGGPFRYISA
jgi:hypothetical protein